MPWAPATARVSPSHVSKPLVSTELGRTIETDQEENAEAIWDTMPGEDMMICFANLPLNYDDAMIVSSKFADYGGFATLSMCTYKISAKDTIPEVGEELCGKTYRWWKESCTKHCICQTKSPRKHSKNLLRAAKRIISDPRVPTGLVIESNITETGEHQIRVLSHSQILTGDKISTTHGQKGVIRIMRVEDLPIIVMGNGISFVADVYMALDQ